MIKGFILREALGFLLSLSSFHHQILSLPNLHVCGTDTVPISHRSTIEQTEDGVQITSSGLLVAVSYLDSVMATMPRHTRPPLRAKKNRGIPTCYLLGSWRSRRGCGGLQAISIPVQIRRYINDDDQE